MSALLSTILSWSAYARVVGDNLFMLIGTRRETAAIANTCLCLCASPELKNMSVLSMEIIPYLGAFWIVFWTTLFASVWLVLQRLHNTARLSVWYSDFRRESSQSTFNTVKQFLSFSNSLLAALHYFIIIIGLFSVQIFNSSNRLTIWRWGGGGWQYTEVVQCFSGLCTYIADGKCK